MPEHGPPRARVNDTNYHAETNILASITDYVRPTPGPAPPGSEGFVVIFADNPVCNICNGYIRVWNETYPSIPVVTIDPEKADLYQNHDRSRLPERGFDDEFTCS